MRNRDRRTKAIAVLAKVFFAGIVGLGVLLGASSARALGPVDLEVAVKGSFGTGAFGALGGTTLPANGLGFGVGGRAGIVYHGAYAGFSAVDYAGEELQSVHVLRAEPGSIICNCGPWVHLLLYGGEIGYGVTLARIVTLRPLVGIGNTLRTTTFPRGDAEAQITENELYVKPGVSALVSVGPTFAGIDLGIPIFTEDAVVVGFTVDLQIGFRL